MGDPIRAGVRRLFRLAVRRDADLREELDDELRFHLEERTAQFIARGLSPEAARREALQRLGAPYEVARAQLLRSARRKDRHLALGEWWSGASLDLRQTIRGLAQRPLFTSVAVVTLALGIGANTSIFSAVDALLLRSLPFNHPAALVDIAQMAPLDATQGGSQDAPWSYPKFMTFRAAQRSLADVALDQSEWLILGGQQPERISGERVSARFLTTLGVPVVLGHDFPADMDAHPGAAPVALISNSLWQRRFNARPDAIGALIRLDSVAYQVIGVLPSSFRGLSGTADVLVPVTALRDADLGPWDLTFAMIGRLKPGGTVADADRDAQRVAAIVYQASPMNAQALTTGPAMPWSAAVTSLNSVRVASAMRTSLLVLFAAVALVLLIACVNLANLLLGRAAVRRQEIAIRLAIGAGRGRLVRLLLCESLVLAGLGGIASMAVALVGTRLLQRLNPANALAAQGLNGKLGVVGFDTIRLDPRAFGFTLVVTLVVALLFGLMPALQATRPALTHALTEGGAAGRTSLRMGASRRMLVVAEVALALILLIGSGLMLQSLQHIIAVDPGFRSADLLTMRLTVVPGSHSRESMPGFYDELTQKLAAVPGVDHVALGDCPPLNGGCNGTIMTFVDRPASIGNNAMIGVHWVTPNWFAALQVPLRRGRMFNADDRAGAPRSVLINEAAAQKYWPHENPIGSKIRIYQGGFDQGATVVGVVGNVRFGLIDSTAAPDAFIPFAQSPRADMVIFLRGRGHPSALISSARRAIHDVAPDDPVYDVETMDQRVDQASGQARFSTLLLAAFAGVAMLLAVIGVYGVMAFGVAQRQREIGIRMALGAEQRGVVSMIVAEGVRLVLWGIGLGGVAALLLTRYLAGQLYDVRPADPATYLFVSIGLFLAAAAASWLPARRASRIAPTEALRRG
ncbi:MAG TPA: ABC transporter permease [Gemmatimonadales bacterium]|jgi:predicted permease